MLVYIFKGWREPPYIVVEKEKGEDVRSQFCNRQHINWLNWEILNTYNHHVYKCKTFYDIISCLYNDSFSKKFIFRDKDKREYVVSNLTITFDGCLFYDELDE